MLRKKALSCLISVVFALALTGCDSDNNINNGIIPPEKPDTNVVSVITPDADGNNTEVNGKIEVNPGNQNEIPADVNDLNVLPLEDNNDIGVISVTTEAESDENIRIYDEISEFNLFLNDEVTCHVLPHSKYWTIDLPSEEYTLSELMAESEAQYINEGQKISNVKYAFIDCGLDEKKDLIVFFEYPEAESMETYLIFTLRDGVVCLSDIEYSYYVYFTEVLDTGYITYSGRENAVTHFWGTAFIDSEGNYVFNCETRECAGLNQPVIPRDFLAESMIPEGYPEDWFDAEECFFADSYNFDDYAVANVYDEERYASYKEKSLFTFYDYNGMNVEPGEDMKTLYEANNIKWYSEEEIDEMIKSHENQIGLTENVIKGNPIEWIVLKSFQ